MSPYLIRFYFMCIWIPANEHGSDRKAQRQLGRKKTPRARERESGSRAPPADKMIKRQISYIIFTLMLPYRNLWEGRDLCGRVYTPRGLILRVGLTAYRQTALSAYHPSVRPSIHSSGPGYSRASAASGPGPRPVGPGIVKNFVLKRCTSGTVYVNNL